MLDEDRWQLPLGDLRGFLRNPGVAQWWRAPMRGATFSPEFVALVSEILGEEPEAQPPGRSARTIASGVARGFE